jgi:hypothetical protein
MKVVRNKIIKIKLLVTQLRNFFAKDYNKIDPRIKELVDAMKHSGLETIGSCQGHAWPPCRAPYVYFKTPVELAAEIEKQLHAAYFNQQINQYWTLQGVFNCEFELCYLLHSPTYDERAKSIVRGGLSFSFREKLDEDLNYISVMIRNHS